jgi:hypothetical protein
MAEIPQEEGHATLSLANFEAFLDRFQHFFDGLIRSVRVQFGRPQDKQCGGEPHGVLVECSVVDSQALPPGSWVNIVLDVEAVSAMRLIRGNQTWSVLSEGLSVGFFDDSVYLAFDDQMTARDEFMRANFLIVGERCVWSVVPNRESPV